MLIRSIEPETVLLPCDFSRQTVSIIGRYAADISSVLPYLNATQPKALYNQAANILRFRFDGHQVTLQQHELSIGGLTDSDEAIEALIRLQRLINETWERRHEITPATVERQRLKPLAVYKLLPGTSCRACGEPTCFVFASLLATGQVDVSACIPLCTEDAYADKRAQMFAMLEAAI
jgi:ArsR family metal-binding transcriptional regulator